MKQGERPTGVIRTLPYFGAAVKGGKVQTEAESAATSFAYRRMVRALRRLATNPEAYVYIAFPQMPTKEVLDCYLLVGGKIRVRARIGTWIEGASVGTVNCWDGSARDAKYWAVLTSPVSFAPEPIEHRGFQGFRYTVDLW